MSDGMLWEENKILVSFCSNMAMYRSVIMLGDKDPVTFNGDLFLIRWPIPKCYRDFTATILVSPLWVGKASASLNDVTTKDIEEKNAFLGEDKDQQTAAQIDSLGGRFMCLPFQRTLGK